MRMHHTVADRINIGIAGPARFIDDNSVIDVETGSFRKFRVGNETDADQDKIGGKRFSVCAVDRCTRPSFAVKPLTISPVRISTPASR